MIEKAVRFAIIGALALLMLPSELIASDPTKVSEWIEQLRHPVSSVRIQAAAKLAEIGKLGVLAGNSLEPLSKCLQDSNSNVRLYASFALGRIEADTERSVSLLIPLLVDPDEHVRYSAEWSISEIARAVSVQELSDEQSRELLGVFTSAENQISRNAFQERHVLTIKLARERLENHSKKLIEIPPMIEPLPAIDATKIEPVVSPNSLPVSMSLYEANDVAGRVQLVDHMASDPKFEDPFRLAVLKLELQGERPHVADYAMTRWQSMGQRLLSLLFAEIEESDLESQYAIKVIERLIPAERTQWEQLCKLVLSSNSSVDLRFATLDAFKAATSSSHLDETTKSILVASLQKLASDTTAIDQLRAQSIETISAYGADATNCVPMLLGFIAEPQLSAIIRSAVVKALPKLAPGSRKVAIAIVDAMKSVSINDAEFIELSETIGDLGSVGAIATQRLADGLLAEDSWTRMVCAASLAKIGQSAIDAAPLLVARIIDPNEEIAVKSQAARALRQMGSNTISMLIQQIQNPDSIVREHVLRALTLVANSNSIIVEPCLSILQDTREIGEVRAVAATAIGSVGLNAQAAIPALQRACNASESSVLRAAATIAIARIEPKQAILIIQSNIDDADFLVRASAAYGLYLCGDTAASLESLLRMLDEPESNQLVSGVLVDLGSSAIPFLLQIAASKERSPAERLICVQAAIEMPTVAWSELVALLDDEEIGDQVAGTIESSENFAEVMPVLVELLREGRIRNVTRMRIVEMIEADGFGADGDEVKWDDTLAINQPGVGRDAVRLPKKKMAAAMPRAAMPPPAMSSAAKPTAAMPSSAMPTSAMQSEEAATESSTGFEDEKSFRPILKHGEDRKVAVFYGTNRSPIPTRASSSPIATIHVVLAGLALAAMVGCFFLFPRHSNIRYAIASLVGMGAVSTVALQLMLLTNWSGASQELLCYGGDYSDQVQYGVCEVSIPEGHQPGELESAQLLKLEITKDPAKHVVLTKVKRLSTDSFHAALAMELDRRGNNIFVFIHGYNVTFEDAARRTGQMAYDLEFPGAPVFYSWPSQANWYSYVTDRENIDLSTSQIRSFLLDIAEKSKADTINLIAHSMGNVGLTAALSEIEQSSKPYFNQVVLAAPDIDASVFKEDVASKIVTKARHTTLYTSRTDLALIASRYFNQKNRVGDSGPEVLILDGIDTIDATEVDSSLLGHSYYGSNVTVLDDLGRLLQNQPIESRHYLKTIVTGSRPYWAFEPVHISRVPSLPDGLNR